MKLQKKIAVQQARRAFRVRNTVRAAGRLRLSVFRSNQHISAQIIDDEAGQTLVSASTCEAAFRSTGKNGNTVEAATEIGKQLAQRAKDKGIAQVAFDRGSYRYHGRVAALANGAREGGLDF
jgi:large subunit ribosomal protein L18